MTRLFSLCAAVIGCALQALAQGMPAEARDNIHALLNNHASITRSVTLTADGYISKTESSDTAIARVLREHVAQMEDRLERGLMVRRWDPAFAEFVRHYTEIEHTLTPIERGLSMTVRGTTPEAIKVAQNHAEIITDFVTNGWDGHNRTHPAVLDSSQTTENASCCGGSGCGRQKHGNGGKGKGAARHSHTE